MMSKGAAAPKTSKVMLEDIWYTKVKIYDISKYQSDAGSCKKTSPGYARWLRTVGDQIRWKYKLLSSSLSSSSLSFHVVDILHYIWSSFHLVDNEPSFNGFNWSSMPVLVEFNEWTVDSKSFISMNVMKVVAINGWTMIWIIIRNIGNANSQ